MLAACYHSESGICRRAWPLKGCRLPALFCVSSSWHIHYWWPPNPAQTSQWPWSKEQRRPFELGGNRHLMRTLASRETLAAG